MSLANLFPLLVDAARDFLPMPDFSLATAVRPWTMELAGDAVDIAYTLGGADNALVEFREAVQSAKVSEIITQEQWADHVHAKCCAANPEKFGDGKFLDFIRSVNWAKLIEILMTIIAVIPKNVPANGGLVE
jgi:hypothetical protein